MLIQITNRSTTAEATTSLKSNLPYNHNDYTYEYDPL